VRKPLETIGAFVDAFVAAWPTGEASGLAEFFTGDAPYRNGPLDPVAGRTAILAALEVFMGVGGRVSVDMVHVVAVGELVMTERIESLEVDGRSAAPPGPRRLTDRLPRLQKISPHACHRGGTRVVSGGRRWACQLTLSGVASEPGLQWPEGLGETE
jgi:uncharacterized protein (TIGR02246 family)